MTPEEIYKSIGGMIRRRRKKLHLTQGQLAAQVGISRASLANIETGRQSVVVHQVYSIAAALELDPSDLLPRSCTSSFEPEGRDENIVLPASGLSNSQRDQILNLIRSASPKDEVE